MLVTSLLVFSLLVVVLQKNALLNSFKNNLSGSSLLWRLFMVFSATTIQAFLPLFFALYLLFGAFKKLVEISLKFKHPEEFGGFLKNNDLAWSAESPSKAIVMGPLIVEFGGDREEFFQKIKRRVEEKFFSGKYPKLTSTKRVFLGYPYYLQNGVNLDDSLIWYECQKELDETYMMEILSELASRPFRKTPNGDSTLWDIFVANRPLVGWKNDTKKHLVVLRYHHNLCDGMSMHKILVGCFADEEKTPPRSFGDTPKLPLETAEKYLDHFTTWCLIPLVSTLMILRRKDKTFKKIRITGEKVCYWGVEKEPKHLQMFGKIRKIKPSVFFTDLLLAAVSKSFNKNIVEKSPINTNFVTFTIINTPYLPKFPQIHQNSWDLLELNNKHLSTNVVQTPITNPNKFCTQTLEEVHKLYVTAKNSLDSQVGYWVYRIVEVFLPNLMYKFPVLVTDSQVVLSNLPTTTVQKVEVFGGCRLVEYSIFSPNYTTSVFSVCINSYGGRLQFALLADKCIVKNVDHAKKCVDDIYNYLDDLAEELGANIQ